MAETSNFFSFDICSLVGCILENLCLRRFLAKETQMHFARFALARRHKETLS